MRVIRSAAVMAVAVGRGASFSGLPYWLTRPVCWPVPVRACAAAIVGRMTRAATRMIERDLDTGAPAGGVAPVRTPEKCPREPSPLGEDRDALDLDPRSAEETRADGAARGTVRREVRRVYGVHRAPLAHVHEKHGAFGDAIHR